MRKKYTVAVHVKRLERMLLRDDPCACCPAQRWFGLVSRDVLRCLWPGGEHPCNICTDFVGAGTCPCVYFGPREAIRITREKLNEYYREV